MNYSEKGGTIGRGQPLRYHGAGKKSKKITHGKKKQKDYSGKDSGEKKIR